MLDNFIFSVSTALPIFFVMCIGYMIKRKGIIDDAFIKKANIMIFNIALPIKLFSDVSHTAFNEYFDVKFIAFIVSGTVLSVVGTWLMGLVLIKKKTQLGAFVHGSFRGNFLYIGLSLMENLTGSIGIKAPLAVAFIIPLYNILAVIILTFTNVDKTSKVRIKDTLKNIGKNPLIIAILLGIIVAQIGIDLPMVIVTTMGYFKAVATPLALLTIGAAFSFKKSSKNFAPSLLASLFKLIIIPTIVVSLAIFLEFNNEDVLLIYLLFGVPTATVSYIMTAAMNGDEELSSNIIMMTTLFSVFTMTIFIMVFKTIGII